MAEKTLDLLERDVDKLIAACRSNRELYMAIRPVVMHMHLTIRASKEKES